MRYPKVQHDLAVQFQAQLNITELHGREKAPAGVKARQVDRLPLIIHESKWVKFADRYFYLRQEGLYRFWDWGKVKWERTGGLPRILDNRDHYSCAILFRKDILELFRALATIHIHGKSHYGLSLEDQRAAAKRGLLSLTCACISDFVCWVLAPFGWKTRRVGAMRVRGAYNTYNNGHQLFEFYWPKYRKWVLADVDMCQMFVKNGAYLNLGEVSVLIQSGKDFDLEPLTAMGTQRLDSSKAVTGEFCGFEMFQSAEGNVEASKRWLQQFLEVPIMHVEQKGFYFCDDPPGRKRVSRYSAHLIPLGKDEWLHRFYGQVK